MIGRYMTVMRCAMTREKPDLRCRSAGTDSRPVFPRHSKSSYKPLILLLLSLAGCDPLKDIPVDVDLDKLPFNNERTLLRSATYQYNLASLVGHAIFLVKSALGQCQVDSTSAFDAINVSPESYLVPGTRLEPTTTNSVLFDRKVSRKAIASLSVFTFASELSAERLAQLTVTDAASLTFPDGALPTNWREKVAADAADTGCPALLIRGAKVRVATYKFYDKRGGTANVGVPISGSTLKTGGELFDETSQSANEVVISLELNKVYGPAAHPVVEQLSPMDSITLPKRIPVPTKGFLKLDKSRILKLRGLRRAQ
jgi:hypothetical protein